MTVTFSEAVAITSFQFADYVGNTTGNFVFTPSSGTALSVEGEDLPRDTSYNARYATVSPDATSGNLNQVSTWTNISSFTVSYTGSANWRPTLDTIVFTDAVPAATSTAAGFNTTNGTNLNPSISFGDAGEILTVADASHVAGSTINGGNGTDTLVMPDGSDISAATITSFETLTLAENATVAMRELQFEAFTTVNGNTGTEAITLTASDGGEVDGGETNAGGTVTGAADIETFNLNASFTFTLGAAGQNLTGSTGDDTIDIGAFSITGALAGGTGTDTLQVSNGANIAGAASFSGFENLTFNELGALTLTVAQVNGFTGTITAPGFESLNLTTSGTITLSSLSMIERLNTATDTTAQVITLPAALANGRTLVAGDTALDSYVITASDSAQTITGSAGDDIIDGGAGEDTIDGGAGTDSLTGGADTDAFSGSASHLNGDTITDLTAGETLRITGVNGLTTANARFNGTSLEVDTNATDFAAVEITIGTVTDLSSLAVLTVADDGADTLITVVLPPAPTAVHGITSAGTYDAGASFLIRVQFSDPVTVTGTPEFTLETGIIDRTIPYESGSGTNQLFFRYTVQAGDISSDLDYASSSALALNGGTIRDAGSNDATLTLPAPGTTGSLGANESIVIGDGLPTAILRSTTVALHPGVAVSDGTVFTLSTTNPDTADTHAYTLVPGEGDTHNGLFAIDGDALIVTGADLATGDYSVRVRTTDHNGNFLEQAFTLAISDSIIGNYWFDRDHPSYSFPTTLAKFSYAAWRPAIGEQGAGVYSLELEVTANGFWPGQTGFQFGVVGVPAVDATTYHELGTRGGEWAFQGRSGKRYVENVVENFGTIFNKVGDRIRLELNTLTHELRVYTKRVDTADYILEGGEPLSETVEPRPGQMLHFAVGGIVFQPGIVVVVSETFSTPVPTDIALSAASIAQSTAIAGATIGTLSATDSDTDDTHTYAFVAGEGDTDNASFTLDGATFKIGASALGVGNYAVRLRVTDSEGLTFDKAFTIAVTDSTAPRVASIARQTPAASPTAADTLVWRVTFDEVVLNVATDDFTVTGTTATVTDVASAGGNAYDVTVSGGDLAALNATATLAFASSPTIEDSAGNALADTTPTGTNDNTFVVSNNAAPSALALSATSINQSAAAASATIGTLTTTDADTSDTHTYAFAVGEGDAHNASFTLDGSTLKIGASALAAGSYSVRLRTTDPSSAWLDQTFALSVLDNIAPAAPSTPDLAAASDSGVSNTDNHTRVTTPTFTGTAEAGSTVKLFAGETLVGTGTATSGTWSIASSALGAGTHSITATATDAASNISAASSALAIVIETTAPSVTIAAPSASLTRTGPVTFAISYSDENFSASTLTLDDITLAKTDTADGTLVLTGSGTSYTATISDLTGTGTLGISIAAGTATDLAGNTSLAPTASATVVIDNTTPAIASLLRQTPGTIHSTAATLTWQISFDADITGLDATDFTVTRLAGTIDATIDSVTAVSASTYDVVVNVGTGLAQLRLDLNATGTGIADLAGNAIVDGGFTSGEFYVVGATNVFESLNLEVAATVNANLAGPNKPAQRFTTAAGEPLTLSSVVASVGAITGTPSPTVTIHADNAASPGAVVGTLTNPDALTANALNLWTGSVTLDPSTVYWIVFAETATDSAYEIVASTETTGGSGDWLTNADYAFRYGADSATTQTGAMLVALGATSTPTITSTLTADGTYGSAFTYTIAATNLPTSFSATGLPAGLTIDTSTGVISGTPAQTGPFNIALAGINASGTGTPATLLLTIDPANLIVEAVSATRAFGQSNPGFALNFTGFVNGDTSVNLDTRPTATTTAIADSPVGTYPIAVSGGSSPNYSFTHRDGILTIIPTSQTIAFAGPGDLILGGTVELSASASSGLPVSFSIVSGPAAIDGNVLATTGVGTVVVRATQSGDANYHAASDVDRSFRVTIAPAIINTPEEIPAPPPGGTAELVVTDANPDIEYHWQRNGADLPDATGAAVTIENAQPTTAGLYSYTASVPGGGDAATSDPVIVGITTTNEIVGTGEQVAEDIVHPNGNIYDQVLLQGPAATITAEPERVTRMSFVDLSGDIVQVEFSGAGTLTLVMDNASSPLPPQNYVQPDVNYVTGHAGIVITGANETTNVSVFTVGRITAVNQSLFIDTVDYDGVADLAFLAIQSNDGKFGGIRAGNVNFFANQGFTGIYAPGVELTGPMNIGDINAFDSAQSLLVVGSARETRIAGGDLFQPNGQPVRVGGLAQLDFTDGMTSHGETLPAQPNRADLVEIDK